MDTNLDKRKTTVERYFFNLLVSHGMSDTQAEGSLKKGKEYLESLTVEGEGEEAIQTYDVKWNYPSTHYDQRMLNLMFGAMKPAFLEYINETCPNAWFKPMFIL